MPHEKCYTAKQAANVVLDKVSEMLKKSKTLQTNLAKSEVLEKKYEGFKAVEESAAKSGASDPGAVAAAIGRKKYGKEAFQHAAAEGHKMHKCDGCGGMFKSDEMLEECSKHEQMTKSELQVDFENLTALLKYEPENSKKLGYKLSEAGKEERQPEASDKAFDVKSGKESTSPDPRLAEQKDPQHNAKENAEGNNELAGTTPTQVGQDGKNMPGGDEIKGHLKLAKFIGMKEYKRTRTLTGAQSQSGAEAQHKESIKDK